MSHLEANLSVLRVSHPQLAALLATQPSDTVELLTSASGLPTVLFRRKGGTSTHLHSEYDPLKEARSALRRHDVCGANYIIILGFGLGYVLDALAESGWDSGVRVFVVDANLPVLRAAMAARDLRHFLSRTDLRFAWPVDSAALSVQWAGWFDPVHALKSVVIPSPASIALNPGFYRTAAEVIQSQTSQIFTDINTLVARSELFLENFVQNLPAIARAPGVEIFRRVFQGTPAVIVSAGPSLDGNIHELRKYQEQFLVLATDTAVRPLTAAGVQPHFICTADPSEANYRHLKGVSAPDSVLVAEATAHPATISDFREQLLACIFERSSLHSLSLAAGQKGHLRAWGSVATMVLDFALLLGCDPVIFIGQDLAYSWGRTYCSGVYFDELWFAGIDDSERWATRHSSLVQGRKLVTMTDLFGRNVHTTLPLVSYWNWLIREIQARTDVRFVNATEGGILKEGVRVTSLRDALFRYCDRRQDLRGTIRRRRSEVDDDALGLETSVISTLLEQCSKVEIALRLGSKVADEPSPQRADDLLVRLEQTKEVLYGCKEAAPIIDALNQMGNVAFLRARAALGNSVRGIEAGSVGSVYGEYFKSVNAVVRKLRSALERIDTAA